MAEGARLESVYRFIPIEGSNPSLTAIKRRSPVGASSFYGASVGTTILSIDASDLR